MTIVRWDSSRDMAALQQQEKPEPAAAGSLEPAQRPRRLSRAIDGRKPFRSRANYLATRVARTASQVSESRPNRHREEASVECG